MHMKNKKICIQINNTMKLELMYPYIYIRMYVLNVMYMYWATTIKMSGC